MSYGQEIDYKSRVDDQIEINDVVYKAFQRKFEILRNIVSVLERCHTFGHI